MSEQPAQPPDPDYKIVALSLGALGQGAYHLMTAAGVASAPWPITAVVACLPVGVLGMGATLAHLLSCEPDDDANAPPPSADTSTGRTAPVIAPGPPVQPPAPVRPVPVPPVRPGFAAAVHPTGHFPGRSEPPPRGAGPRTGPHPPRWTGPARRPATARAATGPARRGPMRSCPPRSVISPSRTVHHPAPTCSNSGSASAAAGRRGCSPSWAISPRPQHPATTQRPGSRADDEPT